MESYRLRFRRSVAKDLRGIPNAEVARILSRFEELARDPRCPGSEKLSAHERYRLRQGAYRILYEVDDETHTVMVVKVAHRSVAYRR